MQDFQGRVAVITGAASGIGRALAERSAQEGMKVVLADIEEDALQRASDELTAGGAQVLAVRTDVSKAEDVEALAQGTLKEFGAAHLLFNNAGVGGGATVWETSLADWKWIIDVNLWGVIHGIHTFVPIMKGQGERCHIINTASIAGLISGPGLGAYRVSKFGVVTLSETLYHELQADESDIGVSVLCPGWVHTRIWESERNRPEDAGPASPMTAAQAARSEKVAAFVEAGIPAEQVADITFAAIRKNQFYILTHPDFTPAVGLRAQDILMGRKPTNPMPPSEP
jgi:NAD(P)-dependent dehydrogenase (short-subunit alcohol dehydrogenase family)